MKKFIKVLALVAAVTLGVTNSSAAESNAAESISLLNAAVLSGQVDAFNQTLVSINGQIDTLSKTDLTRLNNALELKELRDEMVAAGNANPSFQEIMHEKFSYNVIKATALENKK